MFTNPIRHSHQKKKFFKYFHAVRNDLGIVLSGGGSRTAYQIGVLKALSKYVNHNSLSVSVVTGSSIGAVNGIILSATIKNGLTHSIKTLEELWLERNFRNTFAGSPTLSFIRALKIAFIKYIGPPGPSATDRSIFDPTPFINRLNQVIDEHGGLTLANRSPKLSAVGIMTTIESNSFTGNQRKPLLFVSSHRKMNTKTIEGASFSVSYVDRLTAQHGLASAALPWVLPPVELDAENQRLKLVDGGISNNVPVDPAIRLGAKRIIVMDASGREWWHNHYGEAHDLRPYWEVPSDEDSFCLHPQELIVFKNQAAIGPILRTAAKSSTKAFIAALGPTYPIFGLLKKKLGEDLAYEVMSYVALDKEYVQGVIELGFNEAEKLLKEQSYI